MPLRKGQSRRIAVLMTLRRLSRRDSEQSVTRSVQGVSLVMPRSHLLPAYARAIPHYGQNLVRLAAALGRGRDTPLHVLDIGANIGDSTLQIMHATPARVLCVEGDPYWATYLHRNVDGNPDVAVQEALLLAELDAVGTVAPLRVGGTTRFVADEHDGGLPSMTPAQLRAGHPDFATLDLVKSDTDGFDTVLVPAVAAAWADAPPVLFFEFDPILTRKTGADPAAMWDALAGLGYDTALVWDNIGDALGRLDVSAAAAASTYLEPRPSSYGYHFWDVAVCHRDDAHAAAVFAELMPQAFRREGVE